jgi:hypothetical protein
MLRSKTMAKKHKFIVRNELQQFWTGSGWSSEYPDALICDGTREAKDASVRAQFKAVRVYIELAD